MIKDGIEFKKCDKCGKICAKLEMVDYKTCKECVISELEKEIAELRAFIDAPLIKGRRTTRKEFYQTIWDLSGQLTNARKLILRLYNAGRDVLMCRAEEKAYDNLSNAINDKSIEQFLEEIKI